MDLQRLYCNNFLLTNQTHGIYINVFISFVCLSRDTKVYCRYIPSPQNTTKQNKNIACLLFSLFCRHAARRRAYARAEVRAWKGDIVEKSAFVQNYPMKLNEKKWIGLSGSGRTCKVTGKYNKNKRKINLKTLRPCIRTGKLQFPDFTTREVHSRIKIET